MLKRTEINLKSRLIEGRNMEKDLKSKLKQCNIQRVEKISQKFNSYKIDLKSKFNGADKKKRIV